MVVLSDVPAADAPKLKPAEVEAVALFVAGAVAGVESLVVVVAVAGLFLSEVLVAVGVPPNEKLAAGLLSAAGADAAAGVGAAAPNVKVGFASVLFAAEEASAFVGLTLGVVAGVFAAVFGFFSGRLRLNSSSSHFSVDSRLRFLLLLVVRLPRRDDATTGTSRRVFPLVLALNGIRGRLLVLPVRSSESWSCRRFRPFCCC